MKQLMGYLFLFNSFGKSLATFKLQDMIHGYMPDTKVVGLHFSQDEDLILITTTGDLYFLDPCTGELKQQVESLGSATFSKDPIAQTKMNDNLLYFKTKSNQFYWVSDITQNSNPTPFENIKSFSKKDDIKDFMLIPKEISGGKGMELMVTDPEEGFYLIKEGKQGNSGSVIKATDLSPFGNSGGSFGQIRHIAMNSKKEMITFYSESDTSGLIIVLKSDLSKELTRQDTGVVNAQ
jgi:hypothetical protein